jgi:hypothetical protein
MSVSKDTSAMAARTGRAAREALERWIAEADALLAGQDAAPAGTARQVA